MTGNATMHARLALWALAGAVAAVGYRAVTGTSLDGPYFTIAAHQLLHAGGLHVYADPGLQAGPWQLLWFAAVGSGAAFAVVSGALTAMALVLALRMLRRCRQAQTPIALEAAVIALAVGWGLVAGTYSGGHPADLVIPGTWAAAGFAACRDRAWVAGLLVGFGAGWETWGVLGVATLLLLPTLRRAIGAGVVAVATAGAAYLPFIVVGPFRMGQVRWEVNPHTLVFALSGGGRFSWGDRLAQAVLVCLVGALVALCVRSRHDAAALAVWAVPAAMVLAKITVDPQPRDYYWLPVQALLLVALLAGWRTGPRLVLAGVPALVVAVVMPMQVWPLEIAALLVLLVSVATAAGVRAGTQRSEPAVQDHVLVVSPG